VSARVSPVTVVIPTYNERENLGKLVEAVLAVAPDYRVLVVDDNSPDGTGEEAERLARLHPDRVEVLHRSGKSGMGSAYVAGFERALRGDAKAVFEMDADFSHDPRYLEPIRSRLDAGDADVVVGSRYVPGGRGIKWSLRRAMLSRLGCLYARTLLRLPIRDVTSGFKCFRREVLEAIDFTEVRSNGFAFQIEMNHAANRRGFRIAEVPIVFEDRRYGYSKMDWSIVREGLLLVARLFFRGSPRHAAPAVSDSALPAASPGETP
jgi:dolichol-phosphate mannosyltransferase